MDRIKIYTPEEAYKLACDMNDNKPKDKRDHYYIPQLKVRYPIGSIDSLGWIRYDIEEKPQF